MTENKVDPRVWATLNLPFGATAGFVAVMLGFLLREQGMSDAVIASLVALNLLPHTWKFLWAPIADSTLTRKRWYVLSNGVACATILGLAFVPITEGNLVIIEVLVFANSVAISFVGMAVEGLMAHATPPAQRGRAAGWFQVGNVGGAGVGGGLGLYLAETISTQVAFVVIAVTLASCTLTLRLVPEAPRLLDQERTRGEGVNLGARVVEVLRDVWQMLSSRRGVTALVLVFLPIGSAAAQGLFSGQTAKEWNASPELIAITTGFAAGIVAAGGCLVGGWLSDRIGRRNAYLLGGVVLAVIAAGMGVLPKNPTTYAIFTLLYQFGGGVAFGTFTGFVLDVIGTGAAATKYNALASLSNFPIWYMTQIDGWASTAHGPSGMLLVDAGSEIVGISLFLLALSIIRPGKEQRPDAATQPAAELPKAKVV